MKRLLTPSLLSLLIHGLVLTSLLWVLAPQGRRRFRKPLPSPPRMMEIEIESQDFGSGSLSAHTGASTQLKRPTPNTQPKLNMGLAPRAGLPVPSTAGNGSPAEPGTGDGGTGDAFETARVMGIEESTKLHVPLIKVHREIEESLRYPDELIDTGHQGDIQLQFELDPYGQLIGGFTRVHAEDRYLKVHVMRTIRRSLATRLSEKPLWETPKLRVAAHFRFRLVTHLEGSKQVHQATAVNKNVLGFTQLSVLPPSILQVGTDPSQQAYKAEVSLIPLLQKLFPAEKKRELEAKLERYRIDPEF